MNELSVTDAPRALRIGSRQATLRRSFYHWFSELELRGEDTMFRLGRVCGTEPEPTWSYLPHHTFDGLGGLHHLLEQRHGKHLELPQLPRPYPGWLARAVAALRVLATPTPRVASFSREVIPGPDERALATWALFTRAETTDLKARARRHGTSLNAFLLWALTRAIRPLLTEDSGVVNWVVPINMRGVEPDLSPSDNQAATLDVSFSLQASARGIDESIREQRRRNVHWGVWQLLKWLGRAGPDIVRFVARRELKVRKHGSFSNLGNLRLVGDSRDHDTPEWWMAVNPVQRARPLGAACLSYYGRLTLTLQIHPVLGLGQSATQDVMDAWVAALHQPPRAASTSTAGMTTLVPRSGGAKLT